MDILTIVGFAIAGFVLVLSIIFMVGFKTKVPDAESAFEIEPIKYEQWKEDIPTLIIKHYESIYEIAGMPVIKTVMFKGKAKYKISNLWMPVIYHTWIENGTGFLRELDFYWYGKTILKGVDFWINGVGALQVNGVIRMNEAGNNVTKSQYINFLAESLLLGIFDFSKEQFTWNTLNENTVRLTWPSRDDKTQDVHTIDIHFDDRTGRINYISSQRYRGQQENKQIQWTLGVKKWDKKQGMWVPQYHAKWEDQKKPWCHYSIHSVSINTAPRAVAEAISKIHTSKYKKEKEIKKHNNRI